MLQSLQEQEAELAVLLGEIEALRQELAATRPRPVLFTWLYGLGRATKPALPWVVSCVVVPCLYAVWSVVLPHVFGWRQTPMPRAEEGMTVPSKKVLLRGDTGTMQIGTTSACATDAVCTGSQGDIQVPSLSPTPTRITNNFVYSPSQDGIRLFTERAPSITNNIVSAPVSRPSR
jgi:hypothetical protein